MRSPFARLVAATFAAICIAGIGGVTSAQSPSPAAAPSGATPSPAPSAGAAPSVAPSASSVPAIVGPVFPGTLAQAIPPLVNGVAVTVSGPVTMDATAKDLHVGPDIAYVLKTMAATSIEAALGNNDQILITAIRVPGADSAAMDAALLAALVANTGYSRVRVQPIAGRAVHAFDSLSGTQYAWVNGDILFWVLGPDGVGERAVGAMPGSSVPLVPGGAPAVVTSVDLTIGSGPDAGAYHAVAETGGCSKDALGKDQYGLQYSSTDPAIPFSSLQVVIKNGTSATGAKESDVPLRDRDRERQRLPDRSRQWRGSRNGLGHHPRLGRRQGGLSDPGTHHRQGVGRGHGLVRDGHRLRPVISPRRQACRAGR